MTVRRLASRGALAVAVALGLVATGPLAGTSPASADATTTPTQVVPPDLRWPAGVAASPDGSLTVVDWDRHVVLAKSASGIRQLDFGKLTNPTYPTVDASGNRYVTDGNVVKELTAAGTVKTVTFTGAATLGGIGVDSSGTIYVSDGPNHRVLAATTGGVFSTVAAGLGDPGDLAVTSGGTVFVRSGTTVWKIPKGGVASAVPLTGATSLRGLAVDGAGTLYVGKTLDSTRRRSTIITYTSGGTQGSISALGVVSFITLSLDGSGNIYGSDAASPNSGGEVKGGVVKVTPGGSVSWPPFGRPHMPEVNLYDLDVDAAGTIYFATRYRVYSWTAVAGIRSLPLPDLVTVESIAVDDDGTLYVNDQGATISANDDVMWRLSPAGVVSTVALTGLADPRGMDVDDNHALYVADGLGKKLVKRTAAGVQTTVPLTGLQNGVDVAVDTSGSVYFADGGNNTSFNRIIKLPAGGSQVTVPIDLGAGAHYRLATDASGNLFIPSEYETLIKYTPGGVRSAIDPPNFTVGGFGVAVGPDGTVYLSDAGNIGSVSSPDDPQIFAVSPAGTAVAIGDSSVRPGASVAIGGSGQLLVADPTRDRIFEVPGGGPTSPIGFPGMDSPDHVTVAPNGHRIVSTRLGIFDWAADGTTTALGFSNGRQGPLAVDSAGTVYVADGSLYKLPPGGVETKVTITGAPLIYAVAIGPDQSLYLNTGSKILRVKSGVVTDLGLTGSLWNLAVDHLGNVFVSDTSKLTVIERFAAGGQRILPFTGLRYPTGIAVDGDDTVYVADDFGIQSVSAVVPFAPFSSWSGLVTRQFTDLTAKPPTSADLSTWTSQLNAATKDAGDLEEAIRRQPENLTNVDPVVRVYRAFLGRAPDAGGLKFWIARKRNVAPAKTWSVTQIATEFTNSNEFKTKYGSLTNRQFVTRIYTDVLGRTADTAGVDYWTKKLDTKVKTKAQVMVGFSESNEYKTKQAQNTDVTVAYVFLMGRAPTATEITDWVTRQKAGTTNADLALELLKSAKYAAHIAG